MSIMRGVTGGIWISFLIPIDNISQYDAPPVLICQFPVPVRRSFLYNTLQI
jgi:hypothetical protein